MQVLLISNSIDTMDYVTRIGNSSRAPIVIVDFATAHPGFRIPAQPGSAVHVALFPILDT